MFTYSNVCVYLQQGECMCVCTYSSVGECVYLQQCVCVVCTDSSVCVLYSRVY